MANTSSRMLRLLSLLQTHRYWPGTELAGKLDVSPRTLRRDVDRLRELGYPVSAVRGAAGGYQLQAGAALPPLLLDDEEAVAIAVGLRTAATSSITGIAETSVRALTKVVQVMPPKLRRRMNALQSTAVLAPMAGPTIDPLALTALAQACRDDERMRFRYTAFGGECSDRFVEPHRLVALGRRWYLVAWDSERHDWRTFRVDRIDEPRLTGTRFRQRELPGGDPAEYVRSTIASRPTQFHVKVVIAAPAEQVRNVVSQWGTATEITADSCRLEMNVDDLNWPMLVLAAVGADFTIEKPAELFELLRGTAALFDRAQHAAPATKS